MTYAFDPRECGDIEVEPVERRQNIACASHRQHKSKHAYQRMRVNACVHANAQSATHECVTEFSTRSAMKDLPVGPMRTGSPMPVKTCSCRICASNVTSKERAKVSKQMKRKRPQCNRASKALFSQASELTVLSAGPVSGSPRWVRFATACAIWAAQSGKDNIREND